MKTNTTYLNQAGAGFGRGLSAAVSGAMRLSLITPNSAVERKVLQGHVPETVFRLGLQPLGRLPASNRLRLAMGLVLLLAGWKLLTLPAVGQPGYASAYTFTTFAGLADTGTADGVGTAAQFNNPYGIAADTNGNVYVADTWNSTIRMVSSGGVVRTIAGFGGYGGTADGRGQVARFYYPCGIALDSSGNLFVTDTGNRAIRQLTLTGTDWTVSTIAGSPGRIGTNDGPGNAALFDYPIGIAADNSGNLYVTEYYQNTIRELTRVGTNWIVSTIAGVSGQQGTNDGVGSVAQFYAPSLLAVDSAGNLYVADSRNQTVRQVSPIGSNWVVRTVAGTPLVQGAVDGPGALAQFDVPIGLCFDRDGNLYATDYVNSLIRVLRPEGTNWTVSTLAGQLKVYGNADGTGTNAVFDGPRGIAIDDGGTLYITDQFTDCIRSLTSAGVVNSFAGNAHSGGNANGTGSEARFETPYGVAVDSSGNLYVADTGNAAIRKISPAGLVTTLAGTAPGSKALVGTNDGVGNDARFNFPQGLAVDRMGTIYVADTFNHTIRAVSPGGVVTTIAGSPQNSGTNDGPGLLAKFNDPHTIALDSSGSMFVTDTGNRTIRQLTFTGTNWTVSTIAGTPGLAGSDDGPGNAATFDWPTGIVADNSGNVYVSEYYNYTIRKLAPTGTNWIVSTIAGLAGKQGTNYLGNNDGTNSAARFINPYGLAIDDQGALYVGEGAGAVIRKLSPAGTNWVVSTIAGVPKIVGGADGAGFAARFSFPAQLAVDKRGAIFVADTGNDTIRKGVFSRYASGNAVPYSPSSNNGQLMLTLLPPEAQGQWRLPWELGWRKSGTTATNLAVDSSHPSYTVEIRSRPGWLAFPSSLEVTVTGNGIDSVTTNVYFPTIGSLDTNTVGGTLTVYLGANPPRGAGWRFLGDNSAPFLPSGYSTNLFPGTYLIEFAGGFPNRVTPEAVSVEVFAGQPTILSAIYSGAQSPPAGALLPQAVPPADISDLTDYPFGFNGQLESEVGYGSGVAVQSNVVLTAAHLVFNDQTLSYVSHAWWYFQREAGVYEPTPIEARGWYVLSGYAAQRTNDLNSGLYGPGESTAQSRNLDVAALYFASPAAAGGYGGYLPSDAVPNSWLSGTSLKMLVGYPVDGSLFGDTNIVPGRMYQTTPQPFPLSQASDQVPDQQVYVAPWLLSYPGNSGGPLYVQFNGYYYPAGVYLGTLYNGIIPYASVVRGIDSNVVSLITLAQALGDAGTNNTGGGVITITAGRGSGLLAYVQVPISPPAAVAAGAGWRLSGTTGWSTSSTFTEAIASGGSVKLEFKPIPGWNLPTNNTVQIALGQLTVVPATYTPVSTPPAPPVLTFKPASGLGITGTTGATFRLEYRTSLVSGQWLPLKTNTLAPGFNLLLPWPPSNGPAAFYRAIWLP